MPTTEIIRIPLAPGSQIGDPQNPAAAVFKECSDTIAKQNGFQQMQFGMEIENPETLQAAINWDSLQAHKDFEQSAAYRPFLDRFATIFGGDVNMVHADFEPSGGAAKALSAPVTEIATFYFNGAPGSDAFDSAKKCMEIVEADPNANLRGWAWGSTHEEVEKDGVKGKAAILLVGWDSVEAHMEFRKSDTYSENVHLLRGESKALEVHHTKFMNFVPT